MSRASVVDLKVQNREVEPVFIASGVVLSGMDTISAGTRCQELPSSRQANCCVLTKILLGMFYVKKPVTVSKAQSQFPALCRRADTTSVTRRGEVVAFIVPKNRMLDLLEQMEILANPRAMKAINRARTGKGKDHPLSALDAD